MSDELGRIEKPSAETFRAARKLFFVPLILGPQEPQPELAQKIDNYWNQADSHVTNLETKLGSVNKVFHEMIPEAGNEGLKAIERLNKGGYHLVKERIERGAELVAFEDREILAEFMDWSRCLAIGLQSEAAAKLVIESYADADKRRNEHLTRQISETLKEGEIGLLIMREGHRLQFPSDIQVFYVAPPALDDIRRWVRDQEQQAR